MIYGIYNNANLDTDEGAPCPGGFIPIGSGEEPWCDDNYAYYPPGSEDGTPEDERPLVVFRVFFGPLDVWVRSWRPLGYMLPQGGIVEGVYFPDGKYTQICAEVTAYEDTQYGPWCAGSDASALGKRVAQERHHCYFTSSPMMWGGYAYELTDAVIPAAEEDAVDARLLCAEMRASGWFPETVKDRPLSEAIAAYSAWKRFPA